jgi:hypothetical protein
MRHAVDRYPRRDKHPKPKPSPGLIFQVEYTVLPVATDGFSKRSY